MLFTTHHHSQPSWDTSCPVRPAYHAYESTSTAATTPLTRLPSPGLLHRLSSFGPFIAVQNVREQPILVEILSIGVFEEHEFGPFRNHQHLGSETATSRAFCIARSCCNMVGLSMFLNFKLLARHLSCLALHQLNFAICVVHL